MGQDQNQHSDNISLEQPPHTAQLPEAPGVHSLIRKYAESLEQEIDQKIAEIQQEYDSDIENEEEIIVT